jgi:cobalt-zinc-cadmium efflux system membrane fusion protein
MTRSPRNMVYILFFAVVVLALMGCNERADTQASGSTVTSERTNQLVHVSPKAHREIVVEPAQVKTVTEGLTLQGRIQYNPDHFVRLSSPLVGLVKTVSVRLSEQVREGQVVATIESADIGTAYADFAKAETNLELAKRNYRRARDLYEAHSVSKKEFDQAQNDFLKDQAEYRRARQRLVTLKVLASELDKPRGERRISDRFDLKSPIDGVVAEKNLTTGQMVGTDPSQILYVIADLDLLQAVADVYERDLNLIGEGMAVSVEVQSFPDEVFQGIVAYVGDVVDPTTRTTKVRCNLKNLDHKLKPEMFARIHIMKPLAESLALAVPRGAVITIGDEAFVFVQKTETEYERRNVVTGPTSGDLVEIHEGLKAGERVVVKGALLLKGALEKGLS